MATKFDLFSKEPVSISKVDPFDVKENPLQTPKLTEGLQGAHENVKPKALLLDQKIEATVQVGSAGRLYEVLNVNGDPTESRSLEISIKTQSWNGPVPADYPALAGSYPFFENCAMSAAPVATALPAALGGFYAVIEFGTETKKKKITIDCSRGADVVLPSSSAKISVFCMLPGAAIPFALPAQAIGWINVAVSYADGSTNKHNPRLTIFPISTIDPAHAAGLLAGAAVRVPVPAFANRVKVYAKSNNVGVVGGAGNYFVSQNNGTANGFISTTTQALLGNPDWIELGNDAHYITITADLVNIHQVRAVFELDI